MKSMKWLLRNFELVIGSVFMALTFCIVVMNIFTRYFLHFTYPWGEEVAVACFIWVIFMGVAYGFRTHFLIGVEAVVKLFPERGQDVIRAITDAIVLVIAAVMLYFSSIYVFTSTKITAALEISYIYINISITIAFALIVIYAAIHLFKQIRYLAGGKPFERGGSF